MAVNFKQTNETWSLSFNAADRFPVINNRIFKTLQEAQAYVDKKGPGASAVPGLLLSIYDDGAKNGTYRVISVANDKPEFGPILEKGVLERLASSAESEGNTESLSNDAIDAAIGITK